MPLLGDVQDCALVFGQAPTGLAKQQVNYCLYDTYLLHITIQYHTENLLSFTPQRIYGVNSHVCTTSTPLLGEGQTKYILHYSDKTLDTNKHHVLQSTNKTNHIEVINPSYNSKRHLPPLGSSWWTVIKSCTKPKLRSKRTPQSRSHSVIYPDIRA